MEDQRLFRGRNHRRVLYVDDGVEGYNDGRFNNTQGLTEDSLFREEQNVMGNEIDRALEEREFQKIKMDLQKSKDEYMMKEHAMRISRNESNFVI